MGMKRPAAAEAEPEAKVSRVSGDLPGEGSSPPQGSSPALPGNGTGPATTPAVPPPKAVAVKLEPVEGKLPKIPKDEAQKMAKKLKKMMKEGKPELAQQYSKCQTQEQKRQFFYKVYTLDPSVSQKSVSKVDRDQQKRKEKVLGDGWWTMDQVAKDQGLVPGTPGYAELAAASVAGLEERPHSNPALAKLGVKQFQYDMVQTETTQEKVQGLELKETVDEVDTDEFAAMRVALSAPEQPKMVGSTKPPKALFEGRREHPAGEPAQEQEPQEEYNLLYKKAKGALTSLTTEISGLEVVASQLDSLPADGTVGKFKQAYQDQTLQCSTKLQEEKQTSVAKFAAFPGKGKVDDLSEAELQEKINDIAAFTDQIIDTLKKNKKTMAPIKRWAQNPGK